MLTKLLTMTTTQKFPSLLEDPLEQVGELVHKVDARAHQPQNTSQYIRQQSQHYAGYPADRVLSFEIASGSTGYPAVIT